jgi:putative peptidoglycan lipid II flippase
MLPIYAASQVMLLMDRFYASFLGEGRLAALFYGLMLATVLPWIFGTRNAVVAAFAESGDRGSLLARFFSGVLLLSTPMVVFAVQESEALVRLVFGRGRFDEVAVALAAEAFRWYAIAIPAIFLWPVCVRMLQVLGSYVSVLRLSLLAVGLNAVLAGISVFVLHLGVGGLAGVTSAVQLLLVPLAVRVLSSQGVRVPLEESAGLLPAVAVGAVAASIAARAGSLSSAPVLARSAVFLAVYVVVVVAIPSRESRRLGGMVAHSFPFLARFWPGSRRGA